jgi:hypothetical protein
MIGGIPDTRLNPARQRYPIDFFKRALQCSPGEPALNDHYGTLSLMLLSPPTKESVKLIALWAETACAGVASDWTGCLRMLPTYENGGYPAEFKLHPDISPQERLQLVRIINGELYHDWPWGIDRISPSNGLTDAFNLMRMAVNSISDLKDSVFLFGAEHPLLPWSFPFPHFSMVSRFLCWCRCVQTLPQYHQCLLKHART